MTNLKSPGDVVGGFITPLWGALSLRIRQESGFTLIRESLNFTNSIFVSIEVPSIALREALDGPSRIGNEYETIYFGV